MLPCRAWTDRCRDTPPEPRKARIKTGLPVAQNFSTGCFACNATCARTEQTVFGLPDRLSSCCATRRQATALCHYVGHIFSAIPPDQKFHAPLPQGIRYTLRSGFRGKFLRIAPECKNVHGKRLMRLASRVFRHWLPGELSACGLAYCVCETRGCRQPV